MDFLWGLPHFLGHLDVHLQTLSLQYGAWVYGLLFLAVFCETGLVATPFVPGDSLLFAGGALAAGGMLNAHRLVLILIAASFFGDSANYWIGRLVGRKLFANPHSRIFRQDFLTHTHAFFTRHGGKAIVIGRFLPILRGYVPFTAGTIATPYQRFLMLSLAGSCCWVPLFVYAGLLLGKIPAVAQHLSMLSLGIGALSLLPLVVGILRTRMHSA